MYYIGKIDMQIYKSAVIDIKTEDVIITDERIEHIKNKHPNDYEMYCFYMCESVLNPEYIIEANKANSALILKSFENQENVMKFKTVVRLITSSDNSDFKNSVITFMKINDKEWDRLLRNKSVLYKSS